jgi:hypothetical protein
MEKYREVESLLSSKYPNGLSTRVLMEELLDLYLKTKSAKARQERREARGRKKAATQSTEMGYLAPVSSIKKDRIYVFP